MPRENSPLDNLPELQVEIRIGENLVNRDINDDLRLDPDDLDRALLRHSAIYAYYASLTQKANLLAAEAKFDLDKEIAILSKVAREELGKSGARVTDKQIGSIIESQPRVLDLKKRHIHLESQSQTLWSFVKALDHKKECLMQLCNNRRKEMEQFGLRVMKPSRDVPLGAGD